MKKHNRQPVAILTATLLSLLTFTGCSLNPMLIFPEERKAQKHADQLKEDVVEYLNDGDAEALSELFSSEDQEDPMLESRMKFLCDYWEEFGLGDTDVDDMKMTHTYVEQYVDDGEITREIRSYKIWTSDDLDNEYLLEIYELRVNDRDPSEIGVMSITLDTDSTVVYTAMSVDYDDPTFDEYTEYRNLIRDMDSSYDASREEFAEACSELMHDKSYRKADDEGRCAMIESMLRDYFSRDKDKRIPLLIPATMMKKDYPDGKVVEIMFSDLSEFTFVISDDPVVKRNGFW